MKFKKLSVLLVLSIFLISMLPAVMAEQGKGQLRIANLDKTMEKAVTALEKAGEKIGKEIEKKEEVLERIRVRVEEQKLNAEKAQERIGQIQEKFQKAGERYQEAKQKYLEVKENVNRLRQEIQECIEGECEPKKKQYRVNSRDVLIHLSDVVLNTLDKLTSKIEASELSEEEKEELLADIESQKTKVEEAKAVLENLTDEVTKDEIKEAIAVVKEVWKTTKPQIDLGVGKLVEAKLGNIIVQVGQLEEKFNRIRNRLAEQGHDVSALDDYMGELEEKLTSAGENWEMSRERFRGARAAEDVGAAVQEAHRYQERARELIKEARVDIRNIVTEIKGLDGLEEAEEETEEGGGERG